MRKVIVPVLLSAIVVTMANAQTSVRVEKPDLDAIKKIRVEGMENSKVMENAFYLTDVSGPRLTNSPGYKRAADWAVQQLKKIGVELDELTPTQSAYLNIPVVGPYKPDYYRY